MTPLTVYRVCFPPASNELQERFGELFGECEQRSKSALVNFESVWSGETIKPSRYGKPAENVLYTASETKTAVVEKGHWIIEDTFLEFPSDLNLNLILYEVELGGSYRFFALTENPMLVHPEDYSFCHEVADKARSDNICFLIVPSARKTGGTCNPVLNENAGKLSAAEPKDIVYKWKFADQVAQVSLEGHYFDLVIDDVFGEI